MHYKSVNDGRTKGLIITAESLMDLEEEVKDYFSVSDEVHHPDYRKGAMLVVEFLKQSYRKIK